MKLQNPLLIAFAAGMAMTVAAAATPREKVVTHDAHGNYRGYYAPLDSGETTTVAVLAHGRGAGSMQMSRPADRSESEARPVLKHDQHGRTMTIFRRE
jgi:hypothetical protein